MLEQMGGSKQPVRSGSKRKPLNKRVPRMGRVVFSENTAAVHCAVKDYSLHGAVLTMTGWMGLPSNFELFVEPDAIRADCRVIRRRGSSVQVEFTSVEEGVRFRSVA